MSLKIGIIGATGITGLELVNILQNHSNVSEITPFSFSSTGKSLNSLDDRISQEINKCLSFEEINFSSFDCFFFCTENGVSMSFYEKILKSECKVIDLSADFRIKNTNTWEKFYNLKHSVSNHANVTVYGLSEFYRNKIQSSQIIANPGCYPTAALLPLIPLLKKDVIYNNDIIIDAKSGFSGAGRKNIENGLFDEIQDNFKPYNIDAHRHAPEIEQELSVVKECSSIIFTPNVFPVFRGLIESIYVTVKEGIDKKEIIKIYEEYYSEEEFIHIYKNIPTIKDVVGTNNCIVSVHKRNNNKYTIISAIDNLMKGASGQAVQNMNIMFGLKENSGL